MLGPGGEWGTSTFLGHHARVEFLTRGKDNIQRVGEKREERGGLEDRSFFNTKDGGK